MTTDLSNIISIPLKMPKIEPVDWDKWWDLWYKESEFMPKIIPTSNIGQAYWQGFDVYVREDIDSLQRTHYQAKNMNCPELFPSLFNNLENFPIEIELVRVVSTTKSVFPHHDRITKYPFQVRSMLYDNNIRPNFYYEYNNKKTYLTLPDDTNTWAYNDARAQHGSDYYFGHSKLLIMYYGTQKKNLLESLITTSVTDYPEHAITF